MMPLLAFIVATLLPALAGWMLLRAIEGMHPVLLRAERWALGLIAGTTSMMTLAFFLNLAGIPFSRAGFMAVFAIALAGLAVLVQHRSKGTWRTANVKPPSFPKPDRRVLAVLIVLGAWTALKILAGGAMLVASPPGFDDTVKNWNFRGKIFFVTRASAPVAPGSTQDLLGELASYPPAVSLNKAFVAALAGSWNEGLVNSMHVVWFLCLLVSLYAALRRLLSSPWSFAGVYLAVSLPLLLIHGTQAYADLFVACHVLPALGFLFLGTLNQSDDARLAFLRLSALFAALLPIVKNEGLALHLPVTLLVTAGVYAILLKRHILPTREIRRLAVWWGILLCCTVVPWLLYKWTHHYTFGNGKALSGLGVAWSPMAALAMSINLFFEGNWLLLFPLLLVAAALRWRTALLSPAAVLSAFLALIMAAQFLLFSFTSLANEAILQTGFSRGVVQIVPVAVLLLILLVKDVWEDQRET